MIDLSGVGVSHGLATGRALVIGRWEIDVPHYNIKADDVRGELRRFLKARRRAREEIEALRENTRARLGDKYAAIFDAHMMMLDDRKLGRETMARVRGDLMNAEWALAAAVQGFLTALESVGDPYIRERGGDLADVHQRLQRVLAGQENRHDRHLELEENTVVIAHALSPSDAAWLHQPHVTGFVTEEGSKTSHTAILATALEIPAVLGVERATHSARNGQMVVVDGTHGRVVLQPTKEVLRAVARDKEQQQLAERALEDERGPSTTRDGVGLRIAANIEFPEEMKTVDRVGGEGVGLYRTEFLFLTTSPHLPTEEDHVEAYRQIASAAGDQTVVIRTLDLGGEKYFHRVLEGGETNPVLGMRAVRFCLAHPDIFRTQLRGILRVAAEFGNVWLLVPMISGVEEWQQVVRLVDDVKIELRAEGIDVPRVPLGCMIEVPSAAVVADHLALRADFFSIGTNDLIQYLLATDRGNRAVAYLSNPWHPAVLRLVQRTIDAARRAEIPVSLCGEMASDPLGALTLLGMGLTYFSCSPASLPEIRTVLRRASREEARRAVEEALTHDSGEAIRSHLEQAFAELIREALDPSLSPRPGGWRPAGPASASGSEAGG